MANSKLHKEIAKYKLGDPMSIELEKYFNRCNWGVGTNRKEYKEKKYKYT